MVTPISDHESLDHPGIDQLVDHLIEGGVAGIFLLGTCGEGPALSFRMQCELVDRVCEQVDRRLPVLVGVSSPSIHDSVGLAEHAADCGASAVVSTLPYYFPIGPRQQSDHLKRLAERSPLPLIVYNMPSCVHADITPEMLRDLTGEPNIAGFKDSSGDMTRFAEFCQISIDERPNWCRLVGPEHLLTEAIALGGTGGVNGGSNVCPSLFTALYEAATGSDEAALNRLQKQAHVLARLYGDPCTVSSVICGLKMALRLMDICSHTTTELFPPASDEQWKAAEAVMTQLSTWGLATV